LPGSTELPAGWRRSRVCHAPAHPATAAVWWISGWWGARTGAAEDRADAAADSAADPVVAVADSAGGPAGSAADPVAAAADPAVAAGDSAVRAAVAAGRRGWLDPVGGPYGCDESVIRTAASGADGVAVRPGWGARPAWLGEPTPTGRRSMVLASSSSVRFFHVPVTLCAKHGRSRDPSGRPGSRRRASKSAPPHRHS
jgi:hypothetical protein